MKQIDSINSILSISLIIDIILSLQMIYRQSLFIFLSILYGCIIDMCELVDLG